MKPQQNRRPLVLIVDTQQSTLKQVGELLTANGYECRGYDLAEFAIYEAVRTRFDLVIANTQLRRQSGLAMCEEIKRYSASAEAATLFLSTTQVPDIIRRHHAIGGAYYMRKPFDPRVLVELVRLICPSLSVPTPTVPALPRPAWQTQSTMVHL